MRNWNKSLSILLAATKMAIPNEAKWEKNEKMKKHLKAKIKAFNSIPVNVELQMAYQSKPKTPSRKKYFLFLCQKAYARCMCILQQNTTGTMLVFAQSQTNGKSIFIFFSSK